MLPELSDAAGRVLPCPGVGHNHELHLVTDLQKIIFLLRDNVIKLLRLFQWKLVSIQYLPISSFSNNTFNHLPPIRAWKCNFLPQLGNFDTTDQKNEQQTDMRVHREVKLPIISSIFGIKVIYLKNISALDLAHVEEQFLALLHLVGKEPKLAWGHEGWLMVHDLPSCLLKCFLLQIFFLTLLASHIYRSFWNSMSNM